jgi:hypothetical protein
MNTKDELLAQIPCIAFLNLVKAGAVGFHRAWGWQRHEQLWRRHYIAGYVTYPGATNQSWRLTELTGKGESTLRALASETNHA